MSPERKLAYLSRFMSEWIDQWPEVPTEKFKDYLIRKSCEDAMLERYRQIAEESKKRKSEETAYLQQEKKKTKQPPQMAAWGRCYYCERAFGIAPYGSNQRLRRTRDHIHPLSKGGTNSKENIIEACHKCNGLKADMLLSDFLKAIRSLTGECHLIRNGYSNDIRKRMIKNVQRLIEQQRKISSQKTAA